MTFYEFLNQPIGVKHTTLIVITYALMLILFYALHQRDKRKERLKEFEMMCRK